MINVVVVDTRRSSSKVQEPEKAQENKAQYQVVALVQQAAQKTTVIGKPAKMRNLMVDISYQMCCKDSKFYQEKKAEATISAKARGNRFVCLTPYFADIVTDMTMKDFHRTLHFLKPLTPCKAKASRCTQEDGIFQEIRKSSCSIPIHHKTRISRS